MKTIVCALLVLIVVATGDAQPAASGPVLKVAGMSFALSVPDLKASTDWYTTKLGLHVTKQIPKSNGVAVTLLEGGGLMVELIARDGSKAASQAAPEAKDSTFVQGISKVGFFVVDYAQLLRTLKARGVEFAYGPYPAHDDQKANAIVRDNSGNLIQIIEK